MSKRVQRLQEELQKAEYDFSDKIRKGYFSKNERKAFKAKLVHANYQLLYLQSIDIDNVS